MIRQCHFHMDEDATGRLLSDGSYDFECDRSGHPAKGSWTWIEARAVPETIGLGPLANQLDLAGVLPKVVKKLGKGWHEYGLVEKAYAAKDPDGWAQMVKTWGHSAYGPKHYTASAYLAANLARLSREGSLAYHPGVGTGRWSFNTDTGFWSSVPAPAWEKRTSWVDVHEDAAEALDTDADACREYVTA